MFYDRELKDSRILQLVGTQGTQAREIYGKSITILFRYKINQTETDTADGSYSHK